MPIRKPWILPSAESIRAIPAVVGVYEIADSEGNLLYIGQAGGREPFGLRTRIALHFGGDDPNPVLRERAAQFRWEANQQYTTKRLEMLMQFQRDERAVSGRRRIRRATGAIRRRLVGCVGLSPLSDRAVEGGI